MSYKEGSLFSSADGQGDDGDCDIFLWPIQPHPSHGQRLVSGAHAVASISESIIPLRSADIFLYAIVLDVKLQLSLLSLMFRKE